MARSVGWSDVALADVETAAVYLARDSASYAAVFVREVLEAAGRGLLSG
jgi:plasmid stabilization system protein ParE